MYIVRGEGFVVRGWRSDGAAKEVSMMRARMRIVLRRNRAHI